MRKDNISFEDKLKRLHVLSGIKPINEEARKGTQSTIVESHKINELNYAIVKESGSYYLKTTTSDAINESTLSYIGGEANRREYKFNSYADALKHLNLIKQVTLKESIAEESIEEGIDGVPVQRQKTPFFPEEQALLKGSGLVLKNHNLAIYIDPVTNKAVYSINKQPMDGINGDGQNNEDGYTITWENGQSFQQSTLEDAIKMAQNQGKNDHPVEERLEQDIAPEQSAQAPAPQADPTPAIPDSAPAPSPAPAPEPAPAPSADGGVAPDSAPDSALMGGEEMPQENQIDHFVGKLTGEIRNEGNEELTGDRLKGILNSVLASMPLERIDPESRLQIAKRVKDGKSHQENNGDENDLGSDVQGVADTPVDAAPQSEPAPAPEEPIAENDFTGGPKAYPEREITSNSLGKAKKLVVKTNQEIGAKIADIGAGGKEHNVKTDAAWDAKDDKKINEFFHNNRKNVIMEGTTLKVKNMVVEFTDNTVVLSKGDKSHTYLVSEKTIGKLSQLKEHKAEKLMNEEIAKFFKKTI